MASVPLCSVAQVKSRGATGCDASIQLAIDAITQQFEHYCGRDFGPPATRVEELAGSGGPALWLSLWPVSSVTSVVVDGATVTDYTLQPAILGEGPPLQYLRREAGWPRNLSRWGDVTGDPAPESAARNCVVTYVAGFSAVPPSLVQAAVREVVKELGDPGQLRRERMPGGWDQEYTDRKTEGLWDRKTLAALNYYRVRRA